MVSGLLAREKGWLGKSRHSLVHEIHVLLRGFVAFLGGLDAIQAKDLGRSIGIACDDIPRDPASRKVVQTAPGSRQGVWS